MKKWIITAVVSIFLFPSSLLADFRVGSYFDNELRRLFESEIVIYADTIDDGIPPNALILTAGDGILITPGVTTITLDADTSELDVYYIRLEGTTTTTNEIPFAQGTSMPDDEFAFYGDSDNGGVAFQTGTIDRLTVRGIGSANMELIGSGTTGSLYLFGGESGGGPIYLGARANDLIISDEYATDGNDAVVIGRLELKDGMQMNALGTGIMQTNSSGLISSSTTVSTSNIFNSTNSFTDVVTHTNKLILNVGSFDVVSLPGLNASEAIAFGTKVTSSGASRALWGAVDVASNVTNTNANYGANIFAYNTGTGDLTHATQSLVANAVQVRAGGQNNTVTKAVAVLCNSGIHSSATATTVTEHACFEAKTTVNDATSTMTTGKAFNIITPLNNGTLINNYGLYVEDQNNATNDWAIFTNAGTVQFGDLVLIGDTADASEVVLEIGINHTGDAGPLMKFWGNTQGNFGTISINQFGQLLFAGTAVSARFDTPVQIGGDNEYLSLGASNGGKFYLGHNTNQTNDSAFIGNLVSSGTETHNIIIAQFADAGFDFAHEANLNTTLFIQSQNQSTTEYLSFQHDATDAVIRTGAGGFNFVHGTADTDIAFSFIGTTNSGILNWMEDEDRFDFEDTVNLGVAFEAPPETITSTSDTLDATNYFVLVDDDTAGSTVTITLPAISGITGRVYHIKKLGSTANIIIDGDGSETIDGATTATLTTQYESIMVNASAVEWNIH